MVKDESQHVAQYIGGLSENIQEKLEMNSIWSLNEAVNLAFMGEKQVLKSVSRGLSTRKPNASELNKPGPSNASNFFYKKPQEAIQ